jgi:hypothetical protein
MLYVGQRGIPTTTILTGDFLTSGGKQPYPASKFTQTIFFSRPIRLYVDFNMLYVRQGNG